VEIRQPLEGKGHSTFGISFPTQKSTAQSLTEDSTELTTRGGPARSEKKVGTRPVRPTKSHGLKTARDKNRSTFYNFEQTEQSNKKTLTKENQPIGPIIYGKGSAKAGFVDRGKRNDAKSWLVEKWEKGKGGQNRKTPARLEEGTKGERRLELSFPIPKRPKEETPDGERAELGRIGREGRGQQNRWGRNWGRA